jgi:hypothetical protein
MSEETGAYEEFEDPKKAELEQEMEGDFDEEDADVVEQLGGEGEEAFEMPVEPGDEEAAMQEEEQLLEVDPSLLEIADQMEGQLMQQAYAEEGAFAAEAFEGAGNIVGVGFGLPDEDPGQGWEPGAVGLNVYVVEPASVDEVKSVVVDSMGISAASSDDVPVNVIVSGVIDAQPHRWRIRRAPGGVSVGHYRITAGTLGCLALGLRPPRNRRLMILSNNHVLANSNSARFGDSIIQPGRHDGGRSPRDRIAILERFVPLQFGPGRVNYVDAATGWAWPQLVRRRLVYVRGGRRLFFPIGSCVRTARRGLLVGKSGRTTQLTTGRIVDVNWRGWVNYGGGRRAFFRDQFVVRGLRGNFSAPGDSGSTIWTWDRRRCLVGLLFAGGGGLTIANKIWRVLRALDIKPYT